jgi:phospholipase C
VDDKGRVMNDAYANGFEGLAYYPFRMRDGRLPSDPPHGRAHSELQIGRSAVTGRPTMRDYVKVYYSEGNPNRTGFPEPLGFLGAADVPVTSFLARQYGVCDRWFACVPGDTHVNRLMALSGFSGTDGIKPGSKLPLLPNQRTFLDWLDERHVRWRVYRNGLSFLTLMPRYLDDIAAGRSFRSVSTLAGDVLHEAADTFPQVIIVEPSYLDSPVDLEDPPNDNHPPVPMAPGEAYLKRIYEALSANPARWARTLFIVTHDEAGGFYDHVRPLPIRTTAPAGAQYRAFENTGARVPALVISPLVAPGTVVKAALDHTSVLQLLAEKFDPQAAGYSPEVNQRRSAGIGSLSAALSLDVPRADVPACPAAPTAVAAYAGPASAAVTRSLQSSRPPQTPLQQGFAHAAEKLRAQAGALATFPALARWTPFG